LLEQGRLHDSDLRIESGLASSNNRSLPKRKTEKKVKEDEAD